MENSEYILGIQIGHDASAAVIDYNGRILAAIGEERLSRKKNHFGVPIESVRECLKICNIRNNEIDKVALAVSRIPTRYIKGYEHLEGYAVTAQLMNQYKDINAIINFENFQNDFGLTTQDLRWVDHHLGHAASAYYTSGFDDCMIITVDGTDGIYCASANVAKNGIINRMARSLDISSPGYFYSFITELLGFKRNRHEGKITGLAAYAEPENAFHLFKNCIKTSDNKLGFELGFNPSQTLNVKWQNSNLQLPLDTIKNIDSYSREEIASSAQFFIENILCDHIAGMAGLTGMRKVALAGGVFANVKANQKILELPEIDEIYIHPNMGDGGLAAGSALMVWADELIGMKKVPWPQRIDNVYLGHDSDEKALESSFAGHKNLNVRYVKNIEKLIAGKMAQGKVIGRFNGRMEYGPRALGNRSILAAPVDRSINDWLNKRLGRTEFMPFAPSVKEESASDIFEGFQAGCFPAEFMTITFDVKKSWRDKIPAVVHVDGTARPHVVKKSVNPSYYKIIEEYEKLTGIPVILNTSFNLHEEPIVCKPEDAVKAFDQGRLDAVAIGNLMISKKESKRPSSLEL